MNAKIKPSMKPIKKLKVSRERLANLGADQLGHVAGGYTVAHDTCKLLENHNRKQVKRQGK
jgi:hypothetical protein